MKYFEVYEHIEGLPYYLDTEIKELTECLIEFCNTEKQVEKEIEKINKENSTDKHGRKRILYANWYD